MPDRNLRTTPRSDDLKWILKAFDSFFPNNQLNPFIKLHLIVDANIILQDIKYLLTKAVDKNSRTGFLELLESEAIHCYAPTYLKHEISKKLPVLAKKYDFSLSDGLILWDRFSSHIKFMEAGGPEDAPTGTRDPKDWPYIRLQKDLSKPIITKDKDIKGMGGIAAHFSIIASLRTYARESANSMTIILYGHAAISIPSAVLSKAFDFISEWAAQNIKSPPKWFWVISIILVGLLIAYPPSRYWIQQKADTLLNKSKTAGVSLLDAIEPIIAKYKASDLAAKQAFEEARDSIE